MRGAGKSTWAKQVFPNAPRFDLLDEGLFQSYLRDPRLFGRELLRIATEKWVVVDEVQLLGSDQAITLKSKWIHSKSKCFPGLKWHF